MKRRRSRLPLFLLFAMLIVLGIIAVTAVVSTIAWQSFGAPNASLNRWQRFSYAIDLVWNTGDLTQPANLAGAEQLFVIHPDESVLSISTRLEESGLIRSAHAFRTYLIWTGLDTVIQSGTYHISPAQTGREIAHLVASAASTEVTLTVFPGWRMEEIAAALPTSGLNISPDAFLAAASAPVNPPAYLPAGASAEGFLSPGKYTLPRSISAEQLVFLLIQNFSMQLTPDLQSSFASHGLTVYQAVTLASIVQREAIVADEMPMIASVFYNRLAIGMLLQTDPTVQYALGYNTAQGTWWINPLSVQDLQFNSPYNTYIHPGLPPGPISNPGLAALQAVASPAQSNYYYFQARCDGSGLHNFAMTLEQHRQNNCP